jgi:hypothetical protein
MNDRGNASANPNHPHCLVAERKEPKVSSTLLWILAAILVVVGIVQLFQGQILLGVVLIIVGCLVGPGGYSIFHRSHT